MVQRVTFSDSVTATASHAFLGSGADRTVIVDQSAFLRTLSLAPFDAMRLQTGGPWAVTINCVFDYQSGYGL